MTETTWRYDETDGAWECEKCKLYFVICNEGTPEENEMHYCPKCGLKIGGTVNYDNLDD